MHFQSKGVSHNISFEFSDNLKEWNASFKSKTDCTSHLEFPNTENISLGSGYAKLFFTILPFRCLKSVTTLVFHKFPANQHYWTGVG